MSAEEVLRQAIGRNRAIVALRALEEAGYAVAGRLHGRGFWVSQPRHDLEATPQYGSHLHRLSACVDDGVLPSRMVVGTVQVSDRLREMAGIDYDRHVGQDLTRSFLDELGRGLNIPNLVPEETRSRQALAGSEALVPNLWTTAQTFRRPFEEQIWRSVYAIRAQHGR